NRPVLLQMHTSKTGQTYMLIQNSVQDIDCVARYISCYKKLIDLLTSSTKRYLKYSLMNVKLI
ncbi:MAG: hypothetical protein V3W03_03985, partial [Gammaproteobacteria bacterium]